MDSVILQLCVYVVLVLLLLLYFLWLGPARPDQLFS